MKSALLIILAVVFCLFSPSLALYAQEGEVNKDEWTFWAYSENDSSYYVPGRTADKYYTNGIKMTITHQPEYANQLAQKLGMVLPIGKNEPVDTAIGYVFGQNIYTPNHIGISTLQPEDRPYAGWLYGGMYLQRSVSDREFDHLELNMGVVGPSSVADASQEVVHEFLDSPEPRGWDHQLDDEFGINFIYQHKWKFKLLGNKRNDVFSIEAIPQAGFTVGNINRHLNADMTLRAGWHLPADFGPGRLDDVVSSTTSSRTDCLSLYGFVRAGGRYVEHDLFISGNNNHDSHGVAEEHWVGEFQYGIAFAYKNILVHWSNRHISEEFEQQKNSHIIGTWMASITFPLSTK